MDSKPAALLCLFLLLPGPSHSQTVSAPIGRMPGLAAPAAVGAAPLGLPSGLGTSLSLAPLRPGMSLPSAQTPALRTPALREPGAAPAAAQSLILPAQAMPAPKLWLPGQPLKEPAAPSEPAIPVPAPKAGPPQPGKASDEAPDREATPGQATPGTAARLEALSEKAKDSRSAELPRDLASFFDGSGTRAGLTTVEAAPEAGRSLERTMAEVRGLYALLFPGLDPGLPVALRYEPHGTTDANLLHETGGRTIRLRGPVPPGEDADRRLGPTPFKDGAVMSGRIMRLITVFHEYAHVIFYHRTGSKPDPAREATAFDAVNEGFAVMLELLMIDKAVAARAELGLSGREAAELLEWKRERLSMLRGRNHYTEGTLRVWHKLYRSGGLEAMRRGADSLAAERLQGRPLSHPAFVLAGGEPKLLEAFLRGDDRLWQGMKDLSSHVEDGKPISAAGLPAVQNVLSKVRTSSLRRYLRGVLAHKDPSLLSGPLRLCFLDSRAAKDLSNLVHEELVREDPMEAFRGTAWKDALRQLLPLIPARTPGAGLIIL